MPPDRFPRDVQLLYLTAREQAMCNSEGSQLLVWWSTVLRPAEKEAGVSVLMVTCMLSW